MPPNAVHFGQLDGTFAGENLRVYADPGTTVAIAASIDVGPFSTRAVIIGQAIDVP